MLSFKKSDEKKRLENSFAFSWRKCEAYRRAGLVLEGQLMFHPTRLFKFDFAIPSIKVAFEIDGGVWTGGRHNRGQGFVDDLHKLNEAIKLGWRVFRVADASTSKSKAKVRPSKKPTVNLMSDNYILGLYDFCSSVKDNLIPSEKIKNTS